ncbi:MAG: hypothetical protein QNL17_02665 [Synechococcus sp. ChSW.bin.154]
MLFSLFSVVAKLQPLKLTLDITAALIHGAIPTAMAVVVLPSIATLIPMVRPTETAEVVMDK